MFEKTKSPRAFSFENERFFPNSKATWLILPVVISLCQRLSHACVRLSDLIVNLRMAHYISYSLFDNQCYLDNRSNSRANTCVKASLHGALHLLDLNQLCRKAGLW